MEEVLLAICGDFGREVLDAASAAALTQDVAVQRVTASTLAFRRQQEAAFLMKADAIRFSSYIDSQCKCLLDDLIIFLAPSCSASSQPSHYLEHNRGK